MKTTPHTPSTPHPTTAHAAHDARASASRWIPLLLFLLTLLAMGRLCGMDFTWWDDDRTIHHNPLLNPPTWNTFVHYWTHGYMGLYVPVTYMVWEGLALIARVEPDTWNITLNPWVFHTANVLVHAASVLVLFQLLRRIVKTDWAAAAGAALFAVHPVQVETVGWVSGMKDLLCGLFVLLALWQYLLFAQSDDRAPKRRLHYALAALCMVLGMLSKPTAAMTPLMALVLDWLIARRPWRRIAWSIAPLIILAIPCFIWTKLVQDVPPTTPLWSRPLIAADAIAFYLGKLLWPAHLVVDYGHNPNHVLATGQLYWTWIIPAALAIALWLGRRKRPELLAAALLFVLGMLPVLGFTAYMFQSYSTTADHYLYLPMIGVALAAAWAVRRFPRRPTAAVVAALLAVLTARSALQAGYWANDMTLAGHNLEINPHSYAAHVNLASAYMERGAMGDDAANQKAIDLLQQAIQVNPQGILARKDLADIYGRQGRVDDAIRMWLEAIWLADRKPAAADVPLGPSHFALGLLLQKRGRLPEAITQFQLALRYQPQNPDYHHALSQAQSQLHHPPTTAPAH